MNFAFGCALAYSNDIDVPDCVSDLICLREGCLREYRLWRCQNCLSDQICLLEDCLRECRLWHCPTCLSDLICFRESCLRECRLWRCPTCLSDLISVREGCLGECRLWRCPISLSDLTCFREGCLRECPLWRCPTWANQTWTKSMTAPQLVRNWIARKWKGIVSFCLHTFELKRSSWNHLRHISSNEKDSCRRHRPAGREGAAGGRAPVQRRHRLPCSGGWHGLARVSVG